MAPKRRGDGASTSRNSRAVVVLHAPQLLANDARHPHARHAARRRAVVQDARRARGDRGSPATASTRATSSSRTCRVRASRSRSTTRSTSTRPATGRTLTCTGSSRCSPHLNRLRARHPALRRLRGLTVHPSSNPNVLCFSRHLSAAESPSGKADTVITVVSFDAHNIQEGVVWLDLERWA